MHHTCSREYHSECSSSWLAQRRATQLPLIVCAACMPANGGLGDEGELRRGILNKCAGLYLLGIFVQGSFPLSCSVLRKTNCRPIKRSHLLRRIASRENSSVAIQVISPNPKCQP